MESSKFPSYIFVTGFFWDITNVKTHRVLRECERGVPPSLPETRSVGEELLDLKNDLVVDEAEEDGDNHPLREDGRGGCIMLQRKQQLTAFH